MLVYCTDEETADALVTLLHRGVRMILLNERGAEQPMVGMVQRRGVEVMRSSGSSSSSSSSLWWGWCKGVVLR